MAVISTKKASLNIYNVADAKSKYKIGTVKKGATVSIVKTKAVGGYLWAKIKGKNIQTGWAIIQSPTSNYPFIDLTDTESKSASSAKTKAEKAQEKAAKTSADDEASDKPKFKYQIKETNGIVKTLKKQMNTGEVTVSMSALSDWKNPKSAVAPFTTDQNIKDDMELIRKSLNILNLGHRAMFNKNVTYYNRFKVATPDDVLTKTFAHVFFTRPDCYLMDYKGGNKFSLANNGVSDDPIYRNIRNNDAYILQELMHDGTFGNDFLLYLSNKVTSFETRDKMIDTDTYGKNLIGHSIAYGKHYEKSKAAGELSLNFTDDRYLHVHKLHSVWVKYISDVYRGKVTPQIARIFNKELDYAASIYYIVTDETGENIIYWSKLYGVFPTNVPDSIVQWQKGQFITNPEVSIQYQYSFKEDNNPETLFELNQNAGNVSRYTYARTYEPDLGSTGNTWVGAPFVEMVPSGTKTFYKLRFMHKKIE